MKTFFVLIFFALFTFSSAKFRVVGYMPTWSGDAYSIQYEMLTDILYAFVLPNSDGSITPLSSSELSKLTTIVRIAHENNVKVGIAVGGWNGGDDSGFETMAASSTARSNFINTILQFVEDNNLDGVDIDWEYPDMGSSSANFSALMNELSVALHAKGKQLSAAVIATNGGSVASDVFESVDFLNLMAYDKWNATEHSPYSYALASITEWTNRGLAKEKAILGVPFYGRDPYTGYATLVDQDSTAPYKDQVGTVYYNGIQTIKDKTDLALEQGGGIMIWELSMDTWGETSLLNAIDEAIAASVVPTIQSEKSTQNSLDFQIKHNQVVLQGSWQSIQVFNLLGKSISLNILKQSNKTHLLNFKAGQYIAVIQTKNGVISKNFGIH